jgi:hypothetical protein
MRFPFLLDNNFIFNDCCFLKARATIYCINLCEAGWAFDIHFEFCQGYHQSCETKGARAHVFDQASQHIQHRVSQHLLRLEDERPRLAEQHMGSQWGFRLLQTRWKLDLPFVWILQLRLAEGVFSMPSSSSCQRPASKWASSDIYRLRKPHPNLLSREPSHPASKWHLVSDELSYCQPERTWALHKSMGASKSPWKNKQR